MPSWRRTWVKWHQQSKEIHLVKMSLRWINQERCRNLLGQSVKSCVTPPCFKKNPWGVLSSYCWTAATITINCPGFIKSQTDVTSDICGLGGGIYLTKCDCFCVGGWPALSCHTRTLESSPMLRISEKRNVSICLRSNLLDLLHSFSASVPVSPFSPKMMTHTLASVPAPEKTEETCPFRK